MNKENFKRNSIIIHESFYEAIKDLPSKEFRQCFEKLIYYGFFGDERDTKGIEQEILEGIL